MVIIEKSVSHMFFVDDWNSLAPNMNSMKLLLDPVMQSLQDIGMKFGESNCADLQIERGQTTVNSENIKITNFNTKQVKEGKSCLRINENISLDDITNE